MGITWTTETSQKLHILRFVFHGTCCFSLLCGLKLSQYKEEGSMEALMEEFIIPDLLHRIEITKAQIPEMFSSRASIKEIHDKIIEAEQTANGVVVNSFYELEPKYMESYQKATGKEIWTIGLVSLCNKEVLDKAQRGKKASVSESQCLNWLDSRKPKSVIYVCFSSLCRLPLPQLIELGLGLEASKQSFIWVIRNNAEATEIKEWIACGFEERVRDRRLIIRGWVPQILILSHASTTVFLTHCGWNSILEGVCASIPIITWLLFSEQFLNEKLGVHVLRTGLTVGCKMGGTWWEEGSAKELVAMEDVRKAVEMVMDKGEEGEERRSRAREYGKMAMCAMEVGGSSYKNIGSLIEYITSLRVCASRKWDSLQKIHQA